MPRVWVWIQLLIGWVPVWALYAAIIFTAHQPVRLSTAAFIALRAVVPAALLGLLVHRVTRVLPWPRPFHPSFVLVHIVAAGAYSVSWLVLTSVVESAMRRELVVAAGGAYLPFLVLGVWLYVMVAGISYASTATERAARAEAMAARAQLAALRAQLHPHFLFNALHTVVQLIPVEPARAAEAAEQVAGLLRTTIEEDRDVVSLEEEWAFVERYLSIERIRFGERLRVEASIDAAAREWRLPSFALQTLVENAVRHGAAPRVEPTAITIGAETTGGMLRLRVHDTGTGASDGAIATGRGNGTGLARLRERLVALYGDRASLSFEHGAVADGFAAVLTIPSLADDAGGEGA